jgi:hypothetical protein
MKGGSPLKNINRILIQRLRKYNFQNFSQLLNTPEPEPTYFSYFESIANLIYDTVYDDTSTLESEINKDLDKFSEDCITIEDSSNNIKYKRTNDSILPQKDNKIPKNNLKLLLDDPIDTYVNKIAIKYNRFCKNHNELKKIQNQNKINNINNKEDEIARNKRFLNLKSIYISNKDILINIPDEYKVPNEEFKADPDLLSRPINYIRIKCEGLVQMSTQIDKELEKILGHTNKLDHYIQQNWEPWNSNINLYFENIKQYHNKVDSIKKKSLETTSKLILKEIKRKNIKKIRKIFIQFRKMKDSINYLKILITDVKKYKLTNELISKNKNNIDKLKKIVNNKKVSLLDLFELSFNNFKTKNSTHMSGELSQIFIEYFNGFCYIDETFDNNYQSYNITEKTYNTLISSTYGIKRLLQHLQFKEQKDEIEKINSVCEYFIQNNLINSIYIKLRGIFTNLANDVINKMIEFFKTEIEKKEEKEVGESDSNKEEEKTNNTDSNNEEEAKEQNTKGEQCLLLCLIITKMKFDKNVKDFINEILKIINESNDENITKIIKNNFETECSEINKILDNNLNLIIKNQLSKCFNESVMNSKNDNFLKNYYLITEIMNQITLNDDKMKNSLLEYQQSYINNWTKYKINQLSSPEYGSWEPLTDIPQESQNLLNFYFDYDINKNALGANSNDFLIRLEKFEKDKKEYCKVEDNHKIELLSVKFKNSKKEIETLKIKINKTALDIIKTCVNYIKLFCLISPGAYGVMLESFSEFLIKHLTYQKEEIFNYKNSSTVSQKEVCMTYTIFVLVKYIYQYFKDCDFFVQIMKHSEQKSINAFLSVFKAINESLDLSKKKIEEILNNNCIDEALKLLDIIQLPNYNVPEKGSEVPVNQYVYIFISSMKIIYDSMLNCYENDFIAKIFQPAIVKFFDKFEYFIFHGKVIQEEKCLKQFRKDMTFLKKNLNFINVFDYSDIKLRIDNINKKVLPEHLLKAKKKQDEK